MSPTFAQRDSEGGDAGRPLVPGHTTREDLTHPRVDRRFVRRAVEDGRVAFEQVMERERSTLDQLLRRFLTRSGAA